VKKSKAVENHDGWILPSDEEVDRIQNNIKELRDELKVKKESILTIQKINAFLAKHC
jgi:hypothetical protein